MNILYLGYWDLAEPLTTATIFPQLRILQDLPFVSTIVFVNTERISSNPEFTPASLLTKVIYRPLFSKNLRPRLLNKINDFIHFPRELKKLCLEYRIALIIARGAPAGSLAYLCWRKTAVPFLVESFEPHARYMLESGVWNRLDPRYICQMAWEQKQKQFAKGLMPVAESYRQHLLAEGVEPDKVVTVPCSVDASVFRFVESTRQEMRANYRLSSDTSVGIYVGKFGGLYLENEPFKMFAAAFDHYKKFFLIILTSSQFHKWINRQIVRHRLPAERILIRSVKNDEVPNYLMMSDFAYATYKPGLYKAFLSPVKVGEYWACGLPVVMTQGVGDESRQMESHGGGVLFDPDDINDEWLAALYRKLDDILATPGLRTKISTLARKFRNPDRSKEAYRHFLLH